MESQTQQVKSSKSLVSVRRTEQISLRQAFTSSYRPQVSDHPFLVTNQALNENIVAGHAINNTAVPVTFPTGNDKASQSARINAAIVTLQNLRGPGVGCPAASTTFVAQLQAIQLS